MYMRKTSINCCITVEADLRNTQWPKMVVKWKPVWFLVASRKDPCIHSLRIPNIYVIENTCLSDPAESLIELPHEWIYSYVWKCKTYLPVPSLFENADTFLAEEKKIWMNEVIFCKAVIKKEAHVTDLYQDNCEVFMLTLFHFRKDFFLVVYEKFLYQCCKREAGLSLEKSIFLYIIILILNGNLE